MRGHESEPGRLSMLRCMENREADTVELSDASVSGDGSGELGGQIDLTSPADARRLADDLPRLVAEIKARRGRASTGTW